MKTKMLLAVVLLLASPLATLCLPDSLTVLIVADGLRHDHLAAADGHPTPNLRDLARRGGLVADVEPVFPAARFPNVASLATGTYADRHDVIDDSEVFDGQSTVLRNETAFWAKARQIGTIWVRTITVAEML